MVGSKRSRLKTAIGISAALCGITGAKVSWAQDGSQQVQACAQAYEDAQVQRNKGQLKSAQDQLRICVQDECPDFVRTDCALWLSEVAAELPSVAFAAVDGQGRDLIEVKVSVDGQVVAESLDGRAIELDPGQHHVVFEYQGRKQEQTLLVRQGEKNRVVQVKMQAETDTDGDGDGVLDAADRCPTEPGDAAHAGCNAPPPPGGPPSNAPAAGVSPLRLGAYIGGGVGVLGFAAAGVFKIMLEGEEDDAEKECEELGAQCTDDVREGLIDDTQQTANKVTAGLIVGGVGVAAGAVLFFLSLQEDSQPARQESTALRFDIVPTTEGGLFSVGGRF
jgi:hypothetical protein